MATINETDLQYLRAHKVYFEQAKMNFLHGFNAHMMDTFHQIFQRYLQPGYILTPWCSSCVLDMVKRLGDWYETVEDELATIAGAGADNVAAFTFPDDLDKIEPVQQADTMTLDGGIVLTATKRKPSKKKSA
jgi:hypothetical protein